jgi:hypothetical protein
MNPIQIHLMLAHLPVVGLLASVALLVIALFTKSELLFKTACGFLIACSLFAVGTYLSGPPSYEIVEAANLGSKEVVERHALFGQISFVGMILLAAATIGALIQYAQGDPPGRPIRWLLLFAAILLAIVLAWTAHEGGEIRHPELEHLPESVDQ